MDQTCLECGKTFEVTEEDVGFYKKIDIPIPTICPADRSTERMYFRNFRTLYSSVSKRSGRSIISMYQPDTPLNVYTIREWWSDDWDGVTFGREFDVKRPFFDQFAELFHKVPKLPLKQNQCEACEYCNFAFKSRNCYLVFGCVENEDCMYGHIVWRSKDCFDGLYLYQCELCYECVDCVDCYRAFFSTECTNCNETWFSHDCIGCMNCFGCAGLRDKHWCWYNEQLNETEYTMRFNDMFPLSRKQIAEEKARLFHEKVTGLVHPALFGHANEHVSGNHIYFSKNTLNSFDAKRCEDCKFLFTAQTFTDCYDCNFCPGGCELTYGALAVGDSQRILNSREIASSSDLAYCYECIGCHHCFGCDGLRYKQYCILNRQYTKETYFEMVGHIIAQMKEVGVWGQFFPKELSPFGYNETVAHEYSPLSKETARAKGFAWTDYKQPIPEVEHVVEHSALPPTIDDVQDSVVEIAIKCEVTGRPFRISDRELAFYRENGLPLPKQHPDQRHAHRLSMRSPRVLWDRKCMKCGEPITTSIAPERRETVYCERCYRSERY